MIFKPITTVAQYKAALAELERFQINEPMPGSRACDRYTALVLAILEYEDQQ
jgi:antitoxin component HigA of HigAB toxin-antitoxin module